MFDAFLLTSNHNLIDKGSLSTSKYMPTLVSYDSYEDDGGAGGAGGDGGGASHSIYCY